VINRSKGVTRTKETRATMNRVPPTRRLSIGAAFYKRVLPVLIPLVGLAVVASTWSSSGVLRGTIEVGPVVSILTAIAFAVNRLLNGGLADEVLDGGDYLRIRVGNEQEDVPLREIERVEESIWFKQPSRLELVLRSPGKYGRVISFIPAGFSMLPFSRSSTFHELEDRLLRARAE